MNKIYSNKQLQNDNKFILNNKSSIQSDIDRKKADYEKTKNSSTDKESRVLQTNQSNSNIFQSNESTQIKLAQQFLECYNLENSKENIEAIKNFIKKFSFNLTNKEDRKTLAWIISNGRLSLDASLVEIVKKYFANLLNFKSLFELLPNEIRSLISSKTSLISIINLLQDYLNRLHTNQKQAPEQIQKFLQNLLDLLYFQDINSIYNNENIFTLYYSFPFFWANQKEPDTIETEFYYKKSPKKDSRNFVIKILCNPPRLGELEIIITSYEDNIFVNLISSNKQTKNNLEGILDILKTKLEEIGWKKVNFQLSVKKKNSYNQCNKNVTYLESKLQLKNNLLDFKKNLQHILDIKT